MNLSDRQALLAGALLASVLVSFGVDYMKWHSVSGLSWSVTALMGIGVAGVGIQALLRGLYWKIWTLMPHKKMRRRGLVLGPDDAETVRIHVRDLIAEYQKIPRFNFDNDREKQKVS